MMLVEIRDDVVDERRIASVWIPGSAGYCKVATCDFFERAFQVDKRYPNHALFVTKAKMLSFLLLFIISARLNR
jgi:Ethanolamine utilization protein EutJ (predicted chaperonin)